MLILSALVAAWIVLNAVAFVVLMSRRSRPEARAHVFRWMSDGRGGRRLVRRRLLLL